MLESTTRIDEKETASGRRFRCGPEGTDDREDDRKKGAADESCCGAAGAWILRQSPSASPRSRSGPGARAAPAVSDARPPIPCPLAQLIPMRLEPNTSDGAASRLGWR